MKNIVSPAFVGDRVAVAKALIAGGCIYDDQLVPAPGRTVAGRKQATDYSRAVGAVEDTFVIEHGLQFEEPLEDVGDIKGKVQATNHALVLEENLLGVFAYRRYRDVTGPYHFCFFTRLK